MWTFNWVLGILVSIEDSILYLFAGAGDDATAVLLLLLLLMFLLLQLLWLLLQDCMALICTLDGVLSTPYSLFSDSPFITLLDFFYLIIPVYFPRSTRWLCLRHSPSRPLDGALR